MESHTCGHKIGLHLDTLSKGPKTWFCQPLWVTQGEIDLVKYCLITVNRCEGGLVGFYIWGFISVNWVAISIFFTTR